MWASLGPLRSGDEVCEIWGQTERSLTRMLENLPSEKLPCLHRNPVQCGVVASPELWRWSSFRAYALGENGSVRVNA